MNRSAAKVIKVLPPRRERRRSGLSHSRTGQWRLKWPPSANVGIGGCAFPQPGFDSNMISMCRAAAALCLARQRDGDGGKDEDHSDHRKGVAKAHHQRLMLDRFAEGDDSLLAGGRRIRYAVRQEEVRHLGDSVAHFLTA